MRLSIVSRIFAPEPSAASFRLRAVADTAVGEGHTVDVVTSRTPSALENGPDGIDPRVRIRRARVLRDGHGYVRGYLQYLSFDVPLLFRMLRRPRPDVVLVEPPPTTGAVMRVMCALLRRPYVYYAADVWSDAAVLTGAPRPVVAVVRAMERFCLRGARRVLAVSDGVASRLREWGVERIDTIGNGTDLTDFAVDGPDMGVPGPYFVYTGTASEVHGAVIFAEAFANVHREHPEARVVFIGQGTDWPVIADIAATLPAGAISVLPRTEPSEIARWLRGATAALASVVPGKGYDFAFPTKMYAALACGIPVLYAGVGPGRDFVLQTGEGIAVGYGIEEVSVAMRRFLSLPGERTSAERHMAARKAREIADIDAVAARAVRVLESAAAGKR